MLVKEYNKNTYIQINFNDFLNKKYFYQEIIRIKFNKKLLVCDTISDIKSKIKTVK
jgi:transcription-repair coupling factor (superfamily II helicase)